MHDLLTTNIVEAEERLADAKKEAWAYLAVPRNIIRIVVRKRFGGEPLPDELSHVLGWAIHDPVLLEASPWNITAFHDGKFLSIQKVFVTHDVRAIANAANAVITDYERREARRKANREARKARSEAKAAAGQSEAATKRFERMTARAKHYDTLIRSKYANR